MSVKLTNTNMSRDQFAALAMQGLVANVLNPGMKVTDEQIERVATHAYRIADAMVAKRGVDAEPEKAAS